MGYNQSLSSIRKELKSRNIKPLSEGKQHCEVDGKSFLFTFHDGYPIELIEVYEDGYLISELTPDRNDLIPKTFDDYLMKFNEFYKAFKDSMTSDKNYLFDKTCTPEQSTEMVTWYKERTNRHINFVRKYIDKLPDMMESEKEVRKRKHDSSKFSEPELSPYIWISWKYKCLADPDKNFEDYNPPSNIDEMMNKATHHHVTTNSHHPEFHQDTKLEERDSERSIVDATKMPDVDIMEMCADWCAMSEELNNDPYEWAKNTVNKKWKFTKHQVDLLYKTLDQIWVKP